MTDIEILHKVAEKLEIPNPQRNVIEDDGQECIKVVLAGMYCVTLQFIVNKQMDMCAFFIGDTAVLDGDYEEWGKVAKTFYRSVNAMWNKINLY